MTSSAHRHRTTVGLLLGCVLAGSTLGSADVARARAAPAPAGQAIVTNTDRAAVDALTYDAIVPAASTSNGWTGSVDTCTPGTIAPTAQDAALDAINGLRELSGLDPVVFDQDWSAQAQAAALMMEANDALSHDPPSTWRCYTEAGARAAGRSNIALGYENLRQIMGFMDDPGAGNVAVGHRRWILNPTTGAMGIGQTRSAGALWVIGSRVDTATQPDYFGWPGAGLFPAALEPGGRWSLSASDPATDFGHATVAVTGPGGLAVPVTQHPVAYGYGPRTLVWEVDDLVDPLTLTADRTWTVTITGIARGDQAQPPLEYDVTLVPARALPFVDEPAIVGTPGVGEMLEVEVGTAAEEFRDSVRWLRDGVPIPGEDSGSYYVLDDDLGHDISAEVTAYSENYRVTTRLTAAVAIEHRSFDAVGQPVITGRVAVGERVGVDVGEWQPDPNFRFEWLVDGVSIHTSGNPRHVVQPAEAGRRLTVRVRGSGPGLRPETVESAARQVALGTLHTEAPTIAGDRRVGARLRAVTGRWHPVPRFSYQWLRNGRPIAGRTQAFHQVVRADRGQRIRVRIIARSPGYTTASRASAAVRIRR